MSLGSHAPAQSCGQLAGDSAPLQSPSPHEGPAQSSAHARQPAPALGSHAARSVPSQRESPQLWLGHSLQTMDSFVRVATPHVQGTVNWHKNSHEPAALHCPLTEPDCST